MNDVWEIIDAYTDQDALEDGVLIDLSSLKLEHMGLPINRMTRTLYGEFEDILGATVMEQLERIIKTKLEYAGYINDYHYWLPPNIWMLKNEVDGWTLMLPSDN